MTPLSILIIASLQLLGCILLVVLLLPSSYSLFLKHDVRIGLQIGHVDLLSILDDFGMLPGHQPPDVREEKASICVVRVRIRVRVLVMLPMVPHPDPETILAGQGVHVQQEDAHPLVGLEGPMCPQSMSAHCHSLA